MDSYEHFSLRFLALLRPYFVSVLITNLYTISRVLERKYFFNFAKKIRVILQKINKITLEICPVTFWIRIMKGSGHVNMNSIAFCKFEYTLRAGMFKFVNTSAIITKKMMNCLRSIDTNINIAIVLSLYRWCCIKWINSIMRTGEFSSFLIISRTDIVLDIFPNDWM